MKKSRRGTTLVELMIVVAIMGIIVSIGPNLLSNLFRFWRTSEARIDVQQDARVTLNLIQGILRTSQASSITITRHSSNEPPYSKIQFTTPNNHTYHFYQEGRKLMFYHNDPSAGVTHTRALGENLRFATFGFPQASEDYLLSVALCFEKGTYGEETKDFYLSTQRVKVMNT